MTQHIESIRPVPNGEVGELELRYYPPRSWRTLWRSPQMHTAATRVPHDKIVPIGSPTTARYKATHPMANDEAMRWVVERARTIAEQRT